MLSVVVLISGSGSNLLALLEAADNPLYPVRVLAVGSDNPAPGLAHAENFGVPTFVVEPGRFESREAWAKALLANVKFMNPDLVVLAGFMKILPAEFVSALSPNLINMHPSLLPDFPGAHAVRDALAANAQVTGSTIHIVDAGVDSGPILAQQSIAIPSGISEGDLHEMIKAVERDQLIDVVREIAEGKINLSERAQ
ncbi:MAG: phosphoribosylglycinamide formyltransferase [Aquiluna sp.]|nr:phosphoribosylglycinamide formyltransferase [Aquiluna sp.]MCF8545915.1 phosphoribosylglycinamide formyltransferase [Aquiluna sp.]